MFECLCVSVSQFHCVKLAYFLTHDRECSGHNAYYIFIQVFLSHHQREQAILIINSYQKANQELLAKVKVQVFCGALSNRKDDHCGQKRSPIVAYPTKDHEQ